MEVINKNVLDEKRRQLKLYIEAAFDDEFKQFDSIAK
jgi:hypothetical protein